MEKKRLVVKVGTSTLLREGGGVNLREMDALARVLSDLKNMGHQVILVSSGAIGVGAGKLGLKERPTELRFKQAAAAAGQCELMHLYDKFFAEYGQTVAQILLTGEDVEHPVRAEHLTGTFEALLELGCIPVVNENDSVSAAEIETGQRKVLGDNDTLSAIVAGLCRADLLVLLSDIDGLYDADPRKDRSAKLIHRVEAITPEIEALAGGGGTKWGTGGMYTKLTAAKRSMAHGIDMVIANSNKLDALYDIVEGGDVGTRFAAK
ncbi:glutamate 5-kinase [Vermiculatibacterium agrestimuris]|uniref:glutamate 5-kinase n=1 Tax=Vermiculatibacterium agrestimuris TaxID=2941519 RepID=UPI00204063B1|nr:glutamate 5-kinase [Vermiculatibacterium agrestimuris]